MYTSRPLLKNNARIIIKTARPSVIAASLIFLLVSLLMGALSTKLTGITVDNLITYQNYVSSGDFERALTYLTSLIPPRSARVFILLLSIVSMIWQAGYTIFIMNTVKKSGATFGNLLDGFSITLKLILLGFLRTLFITLWSLLFYFPGIIAAYRYRMSLYLLLDHPEMGVMECLRTSKQMMKGHKWECFVLDLSFIGWWLLAAIPYIGYAISIWVTPYINTTYVLYYMALAGKPVSVDPAPGQSAYM
jgi:uncharacterized membrane protein